jgi:hypothetical protein
MVLSFLGTQRLRVSCSTKRIAPMPSLKLAVDIAAVAAEDNKPEDLVATAERLLAAHPEAEETPEVVVEVLREELGAADRASESP